MGNTESKINLSPIFNRQLPEPHNDHRKKWVGINITLPKPVFGYDKVHIRCDLTNIMIIKNQHITTNSDDYEYIRFIDWFPRSNMEDFYVIAPFTPEETKFARDQIIGVAIIEYNKSYILFYYDDIKGVEFKWYQWDLTDEHRARLNADLLIGLHVLYAKGDQAQDIQHLIEPNPEQSPFNGQVILPFLDKKLERYVHPSWGTTTEDNSL